MNQKTNRKETRKLIATIGIIAIVGLVLASGGIAGFQSDINSLKGSLTGVSYNIEFFDNYGNKFLNVVGENIDIDGNIVKELNVDSDGDTSYNHTLSSVLTITIDGKQMESCGDTVIFAEKGLKKEVEFTLSDIGSEASGIGDSTAISKVVNDYKNYFGKSQVVVIQSQLGVPICAYSGEDVNWKIPKDLPKMTKLMIDGKALYIHRANFLIIDKGLLK